ncbi:MAG: hypothetical protein U5J63_14625 [Fodinibius sp.]|nr:hypothetical protein [Fodinibius sp.]
MKPVFQALVALLVIGAIGALVLSFTLDSMIESNLESTTTKMLDTSVEVENVQVSILDGSGTIDGITIHNPEGFSDNPALSLKQISLKLDVYSLLSDTVVVKNVEVQQPQVYFEQKVSGSNLDALSSNLSGGSSSSVNMVINYLLVQDGSVTLSTEIGGEKSAAKATFDRIELEGVGRQGNNTMEQTLRQVLEPIFKKAARQAVQQGVLQKAKEGLQDLLDG